MGKSFILVRAARTLIRDVMVPKDMETLFGCNDKTDDRLERRLLIS
jgi:hypothetical protein